MGQERSSAAPWRGGEYAQHSEHHRRLDRWFLDRHRPAESDVVVDLGCGSGDFTAQLATVVPGGQVIGVDQDASMLERARGRAGPNLEFRRGAAERVDEVIEPGSVDLVVSRAMLHWLAADSHPQLFGAIFRILRPGGWLHLECAGTGNVPRILDLLDDLARRHRLPGVPDFPDTGVVYEQVEDAGFDIPEDGVRTVAQRRAFSAEQIEGFVRTQAILVLTRNVPTERVEALTEEAIESIGTLRRRDRTFDQTFVRLDVLARRPPE